MTERNNLNRNFGRASHASDEPQPNEPEIKPERSFTECLNSRFSGDTPRQILEAFENMGLPAPQNNREFMQGWEGDLIFLNKCGMVIRLEQASYSRSDRINSSPWIMRPIASVEIGDAVIEICPGSHQEPDPERLKRVARHLDAQNINLWDYKLSNVGRLPIRTPRFPEGITVVIDRGGVEWMKDRTKPILKALLRAKETKEATKAQDKFYAPLRQVFAEAYPDAEKMQKFWKLCEDFAQQGKLPAGWNEPQPAAAASEKPKHGDNTKTLVVPMIAVRYEERLFAAGWLSRSKISPRGPA